MVQFMSVVSCSQTQKDKDNQLSVFIFKTKSTAIAEKSNTAKNPDPV